MNDFIFPQLETHSLPPGSNSTWIYSYLFLSSGCNLWSTSLATLPHLHWYVTINSSMRCVWRIGCSSADQMHNKALWTSFLFRHGSRCISFTYLSFCSSKMTSQTVEEKTLTNKISIIFFSTSFSFSSFSLPSTISIASFYILSFSISSFSQCWSLLTCLGVINFNFIICPSCLK